jgi:hypothetical protein
MHMPPLAFNAPLPTGGSRRIEFIVRIGWLPCIKQPNSGQLAVLRVQRDKDEGKGKRPRSEGYRIALRL